MKSGLAAVGLSVVCLIASMAFGGPLWVNGIGLASGIAGLFLLRQGRKSR